MEVNPWMVERMATGQHADRQRAAQTHHLPLVEVSDPGRMVTTRPHRVTRQIGTLLIAAGRCLAGPEALRSALDRSGFEPWHSAA
jgi:hypothetical protein